MKQICHQYTHWYIVRRSLLLIITILFIVEQFTILIKAFDDCPPNATANNMIWVEIAEEFSPTGQRIYRRIPFHTGTITYQEVINNQIVNVEYDNYIRGVLVGELGNAEPLSGGNAWQSEMLRALSVAIRTHAYHRCGESFFDGIHRGINGQDTQQYHYSPTLSNVSANTHQNFQNAINATQDVYLQYQLNTFDVKYRDRTGLRTVDNPLPHKRVYDPVGVPFEPLQRSGLAQINSNYWALGDSQDTPFPTWQYPQILAHYYTDIRIVAGNNQPLTPAYRWNFLTVDWGSGSLTPPQMVQGKIYNVQLELQNTGLDLLAWDNNTKLTYRWQSVAGVPLVGESGEIALPNVSSFEAGSSTQPNVPITLPVKAPPQAGQYTLIIDMFHPIFQQPGYFATREEGRPWYVLQYNNVSVVNACDVAVCQDIYLPLVLKGQDIASPPVCQDYLVNGSFNDDLAGWQFRSNPWIPSVGTACTSDNPPVVAGDFNFVRLGRCENNFDALSQLVLIPSGAKSADMDFDWIVLTNEPFDPDESDDDEPDADNIRDYMSLTIQDEFSGQTLKRIDSNDVKPTPTWEESPFNLENYIGDTVEITFEAINDPIVSVNDNTYFLIDNVRLMVCIQP